MGRVENKATHKPEHILGKLCDISNAITHEHLYFCLGYVTRHWKPASVSQSLLSSGELLVMYVTHWQREEATQHCAGSFFRFPVNIGKR